MKRLTKNIRNKQTYCGYEIKDCKYQQIYNFEKYSELEDHVDCNLTLAVDKLGELEDLEEELGFDLKKLQEIDHIYVNDLDGLKKCKIIGVNFKEKKIWFWVNCCPMALEFEDYKTYFCLREDKSE